MTTFLKLEQSLMDVSAGKTIRLEIRRVPIILIPTTIVTAVSTAIRVLKKSTLMPVALAKSSSKVMANIILYKNMNSKRTAAERPMPR